MEQNETASISTTIPYDAMLIWTKFCMGGTRRRRPREPRRLVGLVLSGTRGAAPSTWNINALAR